MASIITLIILAGFVAYLCYLQIKIIKFSQNPNEKMYCKILLILFIIANLWYYINLDICFPMDIILMVGYSAMILALYLYNLIVKHIGRSETTITNFDTNFQEEKGSLHEFLRKFFHFFVFGGSLLFVFLYNYLLMDISLKYPNFGLDSISIWDNIPVISIINVNIMVDPNLLRPPQMQMAMMTFFMMALPFAVIVERFRLDPNKEVPFHLMFVKSLRESEQYNAAHYYFFVFGVFISAIFLPATVVFGILCVLCFGDTFAGLIGKRCKNHRHIIKWEDDKCWEGAIAGTFFTFITAIFFVGWFLALILGIIFLVIDIITPKLLAVSDNFLYPLTCIVVMIFFIYVIGFQIDAPISNIFDDINQFYLNHAKRVLNL